MYGKEWSKSILSDTQERYPSRSPLPCDLLGISYEKKSSSSDKYSLCCSVSSIHYVNLYSGKYTMSISENSALWQLSSSYHWHYNNPPKHRLSILVFSGGHSRLRWGRMVIFLHEHGLFYFIHITFTQLNVTSIVLGYYMIRTFFSVPIMRLLQPSLWMKVYNVL